MSTTFRATLILAAVSAAGFWQLASAVPPAWSAPAALAPSVTEKVEIYRDGHGVPYVFAVTDKGAYFGAGYAAASDRMFQMCLSRFRYQGRVSEFFGPGVNPANANLDADRRARLLGTSLLPAREAASLQTNDPVTYNLLQAYADGVNRAILHMTQPTPTLPLNPLFNSANWNPAPSVPWTIPLDAWTVADCIGVWSNLGGPYEGTGMDNELASETIVNSNPGVPLANLIPLILGRGKCDDQAASIDQGDASTLIANVTAFQNTFVPPLSTPPTVCYNGVLPHLSHSWAVRGSRVEGGHAVIVSEPRLDVAVPSTLYEWRMTSEAGLNVRGSGVPGSPNMLIGATERVAWGATALGLDQSDLFKITVNRGNGTYQLDGQTKPFEASINSTIQVRDTTTGGFQTPVVVAYRECYWGPLATEVLGVPVITDTLGNSVEYAAKSIPFSCGTGANAPSFTSTPISTSAASRRAYAATSVSSLIAAYDTWAIPSLNVVMADSSGNIGLLAAGQHAVRSTSNILAGWVPLDGSVSSANWMALTPINARPSVQNPAADFILSANQTPVGSWYALNHFWNSYGETDRSRRIRERLSVLVPSGTTSTASPVAIADVRTEVIVPPLRDLVAIGKFLRSHQGTSLSTNTKKALREHLEPWLAAGALLDGSDPASTLVMCLAPRITKAEADPASPNYLLDDYGSGLSGIEYMLKKRIVDIATPGFVLPAAECAVIDHRIGEAWTLSQTGGPAPARPYWQTLPPANPTLWAAWYLANESTRPIVPYGVHGPADPFAGPALTEGPVPGPHGSTLVSSFGDCYSYWMQAGLASSYVSRLPLGESDSGAFQLDQQSLWLNNNNVVETAVGVPVNAGLKSVLSGNAGTMPGTPVSLIY